MPALVIGGLTVRARASLAAGTSELIQHMIHAEAARLLARRELLKGLKKLVDDHLCWHERPQLVSPPAKIHMRLFGEAFKWVLPQIDDLRHVQRLECSLRKISLHDLEMDFPVVDSYGIQACINYSILRTTALSMYPLPSVG